MSTPITTDPEVAPRRTAPSKARVRASIALATVAFLAFVAGLLWVSDALARVGAQSLIARAVQRDVGTSERPSVHLRGAFFLPQVIRGVYGHVQIDMLDVRSGPMRIALLDANLYGVHVPFHDVLVRRVHAIVVEHTDETALIRYQDLNHYLNSTGTPVTVSAGPHGDLHVTGTVKVLGSAVSGSADVKAGLDGNDLELTPTELATGSSILDELSRALLAQRFTVRVPLSTLPFGQHLTRVVVQRQGVVVLATGQGVTISG